MLLLIHYTLFSRKVFIKTSVDHQKDVNWLNTAGVLNFSGKYKCHVWGFGFVIFSHCSTCSHLKRTFARFLSQALLKINSNVAQYLLHNLWFADSCYRQSNNFFLNIRLQKYVWVCHKGSETIIILLPNNEFIRSPGYDLNRWIERANFLDYFFTKLRLLLLLLLLLF